MAEEELRRVEQAEQIAAGGGVERARQVLVELVGVIDAGSPAGTIARCADLATRIEASDLALHYALCLWPGFPSTKVTTISTPFDWAADELVVTMRAPGFGGLIEETEAGSTLREIMESNARYRNEPDIRAVRRRLGLDGPPAARGARRLLVSRRDAAKRRVVNEEALVAALGDLGFEVVVPGALSFAEQVTVFSEAEIVVGPHGAGLANALFMPEGSAMLELHHPDFNRPYYQRLAATLGVYYRGLTCEPAPTSPPDMVAAVDPATALVRTLLAHTGA